MAHNRRENKKTLKAALAREREAEIRQRRDAEMRIYGNDPARLHDAADDAGDLGDTRDPHRYLRSNQRKAAKAVSLGIMTEQDTATLLKGSFGIVADAVQRKNARDCRAGWMPILEAAKLELAYNQLATRMIPLNQMVQAAPADGELPEEPMPLAFIEQPNLEDRALTFAILREYGIELVPKVVDEQEEKQR